LPEGWLFLPEEEESLLGVGMHINITLQSYWLVYWWRTVPCGSSHLIRPGFLTYTPPTLREPQASALHRRG